MKIVPQFSEDKEMFFLFTGRNCPPMFIQTKNNTTQLFWDIDCHDLQDFENWDLVYYDTVDSFCKNDEDRIIGKFSRKKQLTKEFWKYVYSYENRFPPVFSI